jgi:Mn-containing catalase
VRKPYPDKYDLLMDVATEELSHLEIVGATITMLLDGVNGELKNAVERTYLSRLMKGKADKEDMFAEAMTSPQFLVLSGGGPALTNSEGAPWTGGYINANGDLTVDLRSNIAAESRAKIVYEYLLQFTSDTLVQETLGFLMTREIAHFQQFTAALDTIQPNFPPGVLQGDPRFTHTYFDMSNGESVRGPWNEGQGPWERGENWDYVEDPIKHVTATRGLAEQKIKGSNRNVKDIRRLDEQMSKTRSQEVKEAVEPAKEMAWSDYSGAHAPLPSGKATRRRWSRRPAG